MLSSAGKFGPGGPLIHNKRLSPLLSTVGSLQCGKGKAKKKMNKSKIKATVIILVLLVLGAVIAAIATGHSISKRADGTPSASQSAAPEQSQTPEESVQPTPTPEESAQPTQEPEESAKPSKTPAVTRKVSGSGSFASSTGTPLNLVVDYSAKALSDSEIQVTFELYLNCYTINATPKPGGASVTVNGKTYTMSTPTISSSSATPTAVKLCSTTVTMPLAAGESLNVPVTASWAFGGTYSDVDLSTIDAAGTLNVQG